MDGMGRARKVFVIVMPTNDGITPGEINAVTAKRSYCRDPEDTSGTVGTPGMRAAPPGLCAFRFCRCSCSACIVAKICSCCAMKSDVLGLFK